MEHDVSRQAHEAEGSICIVDGKQDGTVIVQHRGETRRKVITRRRVAELTEGLAPAKN